jgi:hypothetical protein
MRTYFRHFEGDGPASAPYPSFHATTTDDCGGFASDCG